MLIASAPSDNEWRIQSMQEMRREKLKWATALKERGTNAKVSSGKQNTRARIGIQLRIARIALTSRKATYL